HPAPRSVLAVLPVKVGLPTGERVPLPVEPLPSRLPRLTRPVLGRLDVDCVGEALVLELCSLQVPAEIGRELFDVNRPSRNEPAAVGPGNPVLAQVAVFEDAMPGRGSALLRLGVVVVI